QANQDFMRF
uniref:FMRFamide-7 n=1 Tax=Lucilia cuprina TaxID=7375 RepID=FAR7_LUCCU|nr:RecName: Full=FMRFamide-7; AltName: Full=LucFMRFamide-7 [Lucilia cuprina]